ncbi:ferredoxin-type protein NapF [Thauera aromatica]|uniref:ferredoxin-type protein NapF n=1 Tax=Thauera aromatica TaxID=59405 RepID=UPI003D7D77E7
MAPAHIAGPSLTFLSSTRVASSRRSFLFGRTRATDPALRPPWAAEDDFVARCTRCERCIEACPTAILVRMDGGFPGVDFTRGECTFCARCVAVCEPQALHRADAGTLPWVRVAAIGADCLAARGVECRVCGESCPEAAIRFRPRLGGVAFPELDAAACTACGACIGPCPMRAIDTRNPLPTESEP